MRPLYLTLSSSLLVFCLWLLTTHPARSLIDTNANGVSDLWEQQFNNGQLFDNTFVPQADADGDGWTNAQEAAADTHPFEANLPGGIIRPGILHIPAVFGDPDENGNPVVVTPDALQISWPTIMGKRYTLQFSTDLTAGGWSEVEAPVAGNGGTLTYTFVQQSSALFWRVIVADHDSDGDDFNDWEEAQKGTDPQVADRDDDGLPDVWEIENGLDPNDNGNTNATNGPNGDADGDGVSNANELAGNTNPNNAGDFPVQVIQITKGASGHSNTVPYDPPRDPYSGRKAWGPWWIAGEGHEEVVTDVAVTPAYLTPVLDGIAFPATPPTPPQDQPWLVPQTNLALADISCSSRVNQATANDGIDTGLTASRVWVKAPATSASRKFHFVKVRYLVSHVFETNTNSDTFVSAEPVDLEIPANETLSNSIDLKHIPAVTIGSDVTAFERLVPVEIVPDWNRDGKITDADRRKISEENPWRFWRNSDDDSGTEGGDDIQNAAEPDYWGNSVDGVRDLVDFFPVHFDLAGVLSMLPEDEYQYFLKHESQASTVGGTIAVSSFNVLWYPEADLEADPAGENGVGSYLKNLTRAEDIAGRTSNTIPENGLQIPEGMLTAAKNGKGVALFECRHLTDKPIILEIRKNDGTSVGEIEMPVKISEAESMFRSKFLNENLDGGTQGGVPAEPDNWPDADRNGKHFIFVHGYNVSPEQARGWNSEMFKRMFWSGSKAMFTGVAWHGNESQLGTATPDYWRNVHNAFQTSKSMADFVNALPGSGKCIAAHSLGNVVVSSAIKDHGLSVANYYMVDAAAAIEAYSSESTLGNAEMSHPDWSAYDKKLWCSEWHKIFPESDNRRKMTWRDRFGVLPNAYNFHSTGEEVLKNGDGTVPGTAGIVFGGGVRAWVKNELSKGSSFLGGGGILHNGTGGWDFNSYWDTVISYGSPPEYVHIRRTPSEAATIPLASLAEKPFFLPFANSRFHDPALGSAEAGNYDEVSKALAESLPSLTFAAGANPVQIFNTKNFDMMSLKNGWPTTRLKIIEGTELTDWRHSDLRNIAFLYTRKVFEKFVELGGLNK